MKAERSEGPIPALGQAPAPPALREVPPAAASCASSSASNGASHHMMGLSTVQLNNAACTVHQLGGGCCTSLAVCRRPAPLLQVAARAPAACLSRWRGAACRGATSPSPAPPCAPRPHACGAGRRQGGARSALTRPRTATRAGAGLSLRPRACSSAAPAAAAVSAVHTQKAMRDSSAARERVQEEARQPARRCAPHTAASGGGAQAHIPAVCQLEHPLCPLQRCRPAPPAAVPPGAPACCLPAARGSEPAHVPTRPPSQQKAEAPTWPAARPSPAPAPPCWRPCWRRP